MKNPKNVVIKKGCHSRKLLSGIYNARRCQMEENALNRCVEDPRVLRTAKSGMTTYFTTTRGFTPCRHPESRPLPLGRALKSFYSGSYQTVSGSSRYNNKMLKPFNQTPYYDLTGCGQVVKAAVQHDNSIKEEALNKGSFRAPLRSGFTARFVIPQGRYAGYSGRTGFTLIELLVVVLIIGILAAVAVPQYQKAVLKARTVELINVLNAGQKAMDAWILENGYKDAEQKDFVLEIPLSEQLQKDYWIGFYCDELEKRCLIDFAATSSGYVDVIFNNSNYAWSKECIIWEDKGVVMCEQLKQSFPDMSIVDKR